MAKANWVKVDPSKGSNNATVHVSSTSEHTGRLARTTTLTWKAAGVQDVVRNVSQAGKPEYVDIDESASANKGGGTVTISGASNSKILTFSFGYDGGLSLTMPPSYLANSVSTSNGVAIAGDPGQFAEYEFSIQFDVPSNPGTTSLSKEIVVTNEAGKTDSCLLTLAAADAYLTVTFGDIELDYIGTPVSVVVESNTTWTIE